MIHTNTGRWPFTSSKDVASCLLLLFVAWLSGCSQPHLTTPYVTASPVSAATPIQVLATMMNQPTPFPRSALLPTWSQLELPPSCLFHSLSPNLRWVVIQGCPSGNGDTDWIAQVDENGKLHNSRQIEGRLIPYAEGIGIMGFTPDSTRFVVERNKTFWFINLADLTQQPYIPGTLGTSGVGYLGVESWSPDGRLYLGLGSQGYQQLVTVSPTDGTENIIVDGIGRHGAQYTWSADGKEIAYIEGNYPVSMTARMINLQTRQSRALVESQYPMSLTGASCSPDGKWVAVRGQDMESSEAAVLWLIDPKTGAKTQLTYSLAGVEVYGGWQDMVWSPDGSKLTIRGYNSETHGFAVIEIPTGKVIFQAGREMGISPLAWSADGKSLLVLDYRSGTNSAPGTDILRWVSIR